MKNGLKTHFSHPSPDKVAPVKVAAFKGMDESLCCCYICCNRNIVHIAKPKKACVISRL